MLSAQHQPIKVFHRDEPTFSADQLASGSTFTLVALVATADLERAFERTQHLDDPWWENKDVHCYPQLGDVCRSSSVGDIFVTCDGEQFMCDRDGWRKLSPEQRIDAGEPLGTMEQRYDRWDVGPTDAPEHRLDLLVLEHMYETRPDDMSGLQLDYYHLLRNWVKT